MSDTTDHLRRGRKSGASTGEASYRSRLRIEALAIAQRLLEAEGLAALQARRIAKEADCAVGSLYNVFGDIDGLIVAVNAGTLERLGSALSRIRDKTDSGTLHEKLAALARAYAKFALDNTHAWEAVFKHRRAPDAPVPPAYLETQGRLLGLIEAAIASSVSEQALRERTARALFGAVHGIVALAIDDRIGGKVRADLDDEIEVLVGLLSAGLADANATRRTGRR